MRKHPLGTKGKALAAPVDPLARGNLALAFFLLLYPILQLSHVRAQERSFF
jgi:hypothetical protein